MGRKSALPPDVVAMKIAGVLSLIKQGRARRAS